jgi:hypothetical protein
MQGCHVLTPTRAKVLSSKKEDTDMGFSDIGLRHIVDVDGQLLGIDAEVIDTTYLLARANRPADRSLWMVRAGERLLVQPKQRIRLTQDEVIFFETCSNAGMHHSYRIAA